MTDLQEKKFNEMHDAIISLKPMIEDHHKTLYGNGREGLTDRMTKIETKIKTGRGNTQLAVSIIVCIVAVISMLVTIKHTTGV